MMPESLVAHDGFMSKEELEYMHASNVNVSNFVSAKLSGNSNYHIWRAQMLSLMDSLMMRGIIDNEYEWPGPNKSAKIAEKYEILLQGWIFGTLQEEVLRHVVYDTNTRYIWRKLRDLYLFGVRDPIKGTNRGTELVRIFVPEDENDDITQLKKKLCNIVLEGNWWKAKSILKRHKFPVSKEINNDGDTILHLAVAEGNNYFVQKLLQFIHDGKLIEKQNVNGQTALHVAAIVGNKYAAELLVKKRKELLRIQDHDGREPLLSAYSNKQLNTFAYLLEVSDTTQKWLPIHLDSYKMFKIGLIYRQEYDLVLKLDKMYDNWEMQTVETLMVVTRNFPSDLSFWEAMIYPSWKHVGPKIVKRSFLLLYSFEYVYARAERTFWGMRRFKNSYYSWLLPEVVIILLAPMVILYPLYQLVILLILVFLSPFFMMYFLMWMVLATVVGPIKHIEKKKKKYEEARHFLDTTISSLGSTDNYHDIYRFIVLEAVRLDVYEVLRPILRSLVKTIEYTNEGHNIIQLAILHRSIKVYNRIICPIIKRKESYRIMTDYSKNNLLHLVGKMAPSYVLSHTTGAALQLQQELQWREEVKKFMEPVQLTDLNIDNETPEMVFTREHESLVKDGEKWMKATAESCSITAALIVTIVFAAAITVPGGSNQETGIPLFQKQIAFTVFAISDAISLFSAATSLLVFLSILTTRFSEKDFLLSLPRRLLIALCLLFLSASAMMLAFGAILFLVFCDQKPWMLAPIGVFACMPIAAIVTLQLPLVVDLYQSTYSSMFEKKKLHY